MKKRGMVNGTLLGQLTDLRHGDKFVICDIGFPIPKGSNVVDLSIIAGVPSFTAVLKPILDEIIVQDYTIVDFMQEANPKYYELLKKTFTHPEERKIEEVAMDVFVERSKEAKLFIRTGETLPASNVLFSVSSGDEWSVDMYDALLT